MHQNNMFQIRVLYLYMNTVRIQGKYLQEWGKSSWTERKRRN